MKNGQHLKKKSIHKFIKSKLNYLETFWQWIRGYRADYACDGAANDRSYGLTCARAPLLWSYHSNGHRTQRLKQKKQDS